MQGRRFSLVSGSPTQPRACYTSHPDGYVYVPGWRTFLPPRTPLTFAAKCLFGAWLTLIRKMMVTVAMGKTLAMDRFNESCATASCYPRNLLQPGAFHYQLLEYIQMLDMREEDLFCSEARIAIDVLEWDSHDFGKTQFSHLIKHIPKSDNPPVAKNSCIHSGPELDMVLGVKDVRKDPCCRIM